MASCSWNSLVLFFFVFVVNAFQRRVNPFGAIASDIVFILFGFGLGQIKLHSIAVNCSINCVRTGRLAASESTKKTSCAASLCILCPPHPTSDGVFVRLNTNVDIICRKRMNRVCMQKSIGGDFLLPGRSNTHTHTCTQLPLIFFVPFGFCKDSNCQQGPACLGENRIWETNTLATFAGKLSHLSRVVHNEQRCHIRM